jgi:hypothetical protein
MTDGGLGIAFFAPFDNTRYFLPFGPIKVSPIGPASGHSASRVHFSHSETGIAKLSRRSHMPSMMSAISYFPSVWVNNGYDAHLTPRKELM